MVLFWPAAVSGQYLPFLVALFTVGCGASILETAANPFMAQFGPAETSEQRLNFVAVVQSSGDDRRGADRSAVYLFGRGDEAPEVAEMKAAGTYAGYLHTEIMRVVPTYLALAVGGAAVCVYPVADEVSVDASEHEGEAGEHGSFRAVAALSAAVVCGVREFLQCGRADLDAGAI